MFVLTLILCIRFCCGFAPLAVLVVLSRLMPLRRSMPLRSLMSLSTFFPSLTRLGGASPSSVYICVTRSRTSPQRLLVVLRWRGYSHGRGDSRLPVLQVEAVEQHDFHPHSVAELIIERVKETQTRLFSVEYDSLSRVTGVFWVGLFGRRKQNKNRLEDNGRYKSVLSI